MCTRGKVYVHRFLFVDGYFPFVDGYFPSPSLLVNMIYLLAKKNKEQKTEYLEEYIWMWFDISWCKLNGKLVTDTSKELVNHQKFIIILKRQIKEIELKKSL